MNPAGLGRTVRANRRTQGLRQDELAALAGVGNRFVSDFENGKDTLEIGRALRVLDALGLELQVAARTWSDIEQRDGD